MAKHDWESASRACKRAMDVRDEVINGSYAGAVVVSAIGVIIAPADNVPANASSASTTCSIP